LACIRQKGTGSWMISILLMDFVLLFGALAGTMLLVVAAAVAIGVLLLIAAGIFFWRRHRKKNK
jgi:uncharacterized iron-regulated membrane protein